MQFLASKQVCACFADRILEIQIVEAFYQQILIYILTTTAC